MIAKTMLVFYGADCLPYKDIERTVHYPIVEPAFQGSSQANEIKFYVDEIGGDSLEWIVISKLPNGKIGAKTLTTYEDDNGQYALLSLTSWYTQAKGDLYLSLRGYDGGAEIIYDEDTETYRIEGNPVVQSTGSVRITIRYSTPLMQDDETQEITMQELLAAIGDRLKKSAKVYLRYYEDFVAAASNKTLPASLFVEDTIVYDYTSACFYHIDSIVLPDDPSNTTTVGATYTLVQSPFSVDAQLSTTSTNPVQNKVITNALNNKVDKTTQSYKIYATDTLGGQTYVNYDIGVSNGAIVQRFGEEILVPQTPTLNFSAASKLYVDNVRAVAEGKTKSIVISYQATAPTTNNQARTLKKLDGTSFDDLQDFEDYVGEATLVNSTFNSQNDDVELLYGGDAMYLIDTTLTVLRSQDYYGGLSLGSNIFIIETEVPDRWWGGEADLAYKLETSKVDLTNYYVKNESIVPTSNGSYNLGSSTYTFNDLYLSGNIDFGDGAIVYKDSSNRVAIKYNNSDVIKVGGTNTVIGNRLDPNSDSSQDIGRDVAKWRHIWFSGNLKGGSVLTQAQYDALVSGGTVDSDTFYFIEEE